MKKSYNILILFLISATLVHSLNSKLPEQVAVSSQLEETRDLKITNSQQTKEIEKEAALLELSTKQPDEMEPQITQSAPAVIVPEKNGETSHSFYGKIGNMKQKVQISIDYYFNKCELKKNIYLALTVNAIH